MLYDIAIIGGGPAGTAAGVYASRKRLKTVFITESFGGQSIVSPKIENWIGDISIAGNELAEKFEEHLKAYADDVLDIKKGEKVESIVKEEKLFALTTQKETYRSKTALITSGSQRRKLKVPGAEQFEHKGLTYCASCDGPLFRDKEVVVIGGGNAGFETASQLLAYAKSVTLLHSKENFKADPITVKKVLENPKMTALTNANTKEVKGSVMTESLIYEDKKTGEIHEIPAQGIFVEIGLIPNTYFLEGLLELNKYKQIKIDPKTQKTSVEGIWAAGDCTDTLYQQNNIAAGDAVRALEDLYVYLRTK